jgi:acyl-CoA hydrolase
VLFKAPIRIGELVTFLAKVNDTGRTSMEVGIKVVAESVTTQERRHAMTSYFTMVAVDEAGLPRAVSALIARDTAEAQRQGAAKLRRDLRREIAARYSEIKKAGLDTSG